MKHLKIGIDIDNVIADSYPLYIDAFNKEFGTTVQYEEIFHFYYLEKNVGIEEAKVSEFIESIVHSEEFQLRIPPVVNALSIIKKWIKQGYWIHYITSRPIDTKNETLKWLKKHGFWVKGVTLDLYNEKEHNFKHISRINNYKRDIADKKKLDIFIEDSLDISKSLDIPVYLIDRPWNQGTLPENVKRVKNWEEIDQWVAKTF
ncbi:hypothetical protein HY029_00815 [Candidatus Gottesmanbacteria bacterium]|nr:hypothetical protein [Candidatus Gottesmanbacteria bacterium]